MKIAIVIVTFNRIEKLKKALDKYHNQSVSFDDLIVVDNASSDGTGDFLKHWLNIPDNNYQKHVVTMDSNRGGAGGFYSGEKYAMSLHADWICVADDDAYPDYDVISKFKIFVEAHKNENISAICSSVKLMNNQICFEHRRRIVFKYGFIYKEFFSKLKDYEDDFFSIDELSYVGAFLNANALQDKGLCIPNLFIYCDDSEHSLRLRQWGSIYCVPQIVFHHDSGELEQKSDNSVLISWRNYYYMRNVIYMLSIHRPLAAYYRCLVYFKRSLIRFFLRPQCLILCLKAIINGIIGRIGIHSIYKPGFSISK